MAPAARASAPDLFGFGARSSAMGATGAAWTDDYEAVHENPAGLARARGRRLTLGYVYGRYRLSLDGMPRDVRDTNGVVIGAQLPLPLGGVLRDRLALGLGFYLPAGLINSALSPYPEQPMLAVLDNRTQTVTIMVAGAARLPAGISIGVGVLALAALDGKIVIDADPAGHISSTSEEQLVTNFTATAGIQARVGRRVRLGAVFRGESLARQDVEVDPQLKNAIPFDLPQITVAGVSQYDPMQAAAEVAVDAGPVLLAAQLEWKHWSAYPNPSEPATAGTPAFTPPGFRDTVVPRVGVEWKHDWQRGPVGLGLVLRGGYFFEMTPAPDAAPDRTALDASRHVICAGLELDLHYRWAPLRLATFFQWHQLQPNERVSGGFAAGGLTLGLDLGR